MASKTDVIKIEGIPAVVEILEKIAPNHARNLLRATIHGVASEIAKKAKEKAKRGKTGRLKRAIKSRRLRSPPWKPIAEVYVNRGTSRKDSKGAFYWLFQEYGTAAPNYLPEQPFIRPAKQQFYANARSIFEEQFVKKLKSKLARELKKKRK